MACYFRAIRQVFEKAGIQVTKENRKELDNVIKTIVDAESEHCPEVWKAVKKRLAEDEQAFISELKKAWAKRDSPY
jgi:hypothetical protein